jgi:uncharacterized protein with PIN domain
MAKKEYTLKIKLVCGKCFRELEFNEGSDGDVDLEIQAQLCPDCMEALKNKTAKEVGDKVAKAFHTAMQMQLTDVIEL